MTKVVMNIVILLDIRKYGENTSLLISLKHTL